MNRSLNIFLAGVIFYGLQLPTPAAANDFPTAARAEYVLACMSDGGKPGHQLGQCACAIDKIADDLPYENYVSAETVLRMRKMNGEKGSLFRESDSFNEILSSLKHAEAAAETKCF